MKDRPIAGLLFFVLPVRTTKGFHQASAGFVSLFFSQSHPFIAPWPSYPGPRKTPVFSMTFYNAFHSQGSKHLTFLFETLTSAALHSVFLFLEQLPLLPRCQVMGAACQLMVSQN